MMIKGETYDEYFFRSSAEMYLNIFHQFGEEDAENFLNEAWQIYLEKIVEMKLNK